MNLYFGIVKIISVALMMLALTACNDTSVKCIFADEFGDTNTEWLTVRPGGENCILLCEQQCRTVFADPSGANFTDGIINDCIPACKVGTIYTYGGQSIRNACSSTNNTFQYDPSSNALGNYLYSPGSTLNTNESVSITLDPNGINALALCGIQSAWLLPQPWLFSPSQTHARSCTGLFCLPSLGFTNPSSSNSSYGSDIGHWRADNSSITDSGIDARDGDTVSIVWYGPYMSDYNSSRIPKAITDPIDSSLFMRNPSAAGSYRLQPTNLNQLYALPGCALDRAYPNTNYIGQFEGPTGNVINTPQTTTTFLGLSGSLSTMNLAHLTVDNLSTDAALDTLDKRVEKCLNLAPSDPQYLVERCANTWKDNTGRISTNGFNYTYFDPSAQSYLPKNVIKYHLGGQLSGFSSSFSRLAFLHPVRNSRAGYTCSTSGPNGSLQSSLWQNNIGGLSVFVNRMGCTYNSGKKLLYAFALIKANGEYALPATPPVIGNRNTSSDSNALTTAWAEVPSAVINGSSAIPFPTELASQPSASKGAKLWLAIDSQINENNYREPSPLYNNPYDLVTPGKAADLYTQKHRHGQYDLVIVKTAAEGHTFVNLISNPINMVHNYLFGSDGAHGIVESVFTQYVVNSTFNTAIRACLVLYIAVTGLLFILGISPITQQEAIPRVLKFAFVAILLAPNSWQFLYQNVFRIFTDGTVEAIAYINGAVNLSALENIEQIAVATSVDQQISAIRYDVSQAFAIFDILSGIFFSSDTWFKILALALSTFIGFFLAVVMVISFCYALIGIFNAVLVYLTSLIGIAILLMVSPLFFTFLLFKTTKSIFDNWLKQLMSFAIQPIVVISGITLLSYMLIVAVYSTLGFTACRACLIAIEIPTVISVCLLPTFYTLSSLFMPNDGFGSPLLLVTPLFCLLILGQAIYVFSSFGAMLGNFLVMSYTGVNLSTVATQSNPITSFAKAGSQALGMDSETIEKRNKILTAGNKIFRK